MVNCIHGCGDCDYCVCLIPEDNLEYNFCKQYYEVRFLQCVEQCYHEQGNGIYQVIFIQIV